MSVWTLNLFWKGGNPPDGLRIPEPGAEELLQAEKGNMKNQQDFGGQSDTLSTSHVAALAQVR